MPQNVASMKNIAVLILLMSSSVLFGQEISDPRMISVEHFDERHSDLSGYKATNIGPTVFSGRVSDLAVDPNDPSHFYVAYASGGLWETKNNGASFEPLFDSEVVMTIGAIAVNWESGDIWVGTGEVNSSRSSYAGVGVYKSSDLGQSWTYLGLPESHHIGRIILHPDDRNTAWIAVLGHLYTDNPERGVYMTSDGGESWEQTLAINDRTGVVDLTLDSTAPNTLYAAAWERDRKAWNFTESGSGSGIYKSTDGGRNWTKVTTGNSGFPTGTGVGRIGLSSVAGQGNNSVLYALLDNYDRRPKEDEEKEEGLTKEAFKSMSKADFEALEEESLKEFLKENRFPEEYSSEKVKEMVSNNKIVPADLANYLEDANALLFDTPVIGAELYRSDDQGETWTKTHEGYFDGLYYSYGYYFGVIQTNPENPEQVYVAGVPILRSDDGGKTFKNVNGSNVHVDHHAIWINPDNPRHIINGNDGGINISYDEGEHWFKCNSPSVGQFYYINVDHAKPYNVYGGTQDNGVWVGQNNYRSGVRWHNTGKYPYQSLLGGDGMQVQIDPRDNNTVYTGFQFGNYFRIDKSSGQRSYITPKHELGDRPYRWNWQAPIHLSTHNPDILYMGAHQLFRSMNQGDDFEAISEDLTQGGRQGDVPYGTLASIHESDIRFGLLYTGSDDGLIHVSRDGGHSWAKISDNLPQNLWVSRVQASAHDEATVYASLNGYRSDDFKSYVYSSSDYGKTWSKIGTNLPMEPVNVIKEDPHHAEILYVGTDRGVYVSLDRGGNFQRIASDLPNVPVHDLVIQKEAKDLLVGTHGRSIFKLDLSALYALKKSPKELICQSVKKIRFNENLGNRNNSYSDYRTYEMNIAAIDPKGGDGTLTITNEESKVLYQKDLDLEKGVNYIEYDLSMNQDMDQMTESVDGETRKPAMNGKYYLLPGTYHINIIIDEVTASHEFKITDE